MCRRGRRHKIRAGLAASDMVGATAAKRKVLFQQPPLVDVGMCMGREPSSTYGQFVLFGILGALWYKS